MNGSWTLNRCRSRTSGVRSVSFAPKTSESFEGGAEIAMIQGGTKSLDR
jgi:hypothetical protein